MLEQKKLDTIKAWFMSEIKDEGDKFVASNLETWIAKIGPEDALFTVAGFYYSGEERVKIRLDHRMAIEFMKLSSDLGYGPAKVNLMAALHSDTMSTGQIEYLNKLGDESFVYLLTDAIKGDKVSQYNLGNFIFYKYMKRNLTIKERYSEVVFWYQKSADQNYQPAINSLQYTKYLLEELS